MPSAFRWTVAQHDPDRAETLCRVLSVSAPAARVLCARGFSDPDSARKFLQPSLKDLHDPFLLTGMREAVERIHAAIGRRERILIYGDYDVDGVTSVVILKKAIELAGGSADFYVPDRLKDGYGMRSDAVDAAARDGVALIISVDTGIRATGEVRRASALGIDVIVTDHHLPEAELPPALAVLNPNRQDCAYPNKNLCGVGVAFKLVSGLLSTLPWTEERRRRMEASFLKLVAIGTVADVVPLSGENRILVKHGLAGLQAVRNPGLRALLSVSGLDGIVPSAGQVAYRLAPRMNAAGRMATAADAIELFLTEDEERARLLAGQLHQWNAERQQAEAEIVRLILAECEQTPVTADQAALVFAGENWHRGVLGIVASRLTERFYRPAFVLSSNPEDGLTTGSGRSIPAFPLLEAMETMADLFVRFGGHKYAAGLVLASDRIAEFRERLNAYACATLAAEDRKPRLTVDCWLELTEIDDRSVADVLSLSPFGYGNPTPVFAVAQAEVAGQPVLWKEKHLRFAVRQGARFLNLKAWNLAGRAAEISAGDRIDVAFSLEDDPRGLARGFSAWSAVLRDFRPA